MTDFVRLTAATAALLATCILAGIAGLAVGELIPDRLVAEALHDARAEGSLTPTTREPTRLGGVADHITECGEISFGLGEAADAGFLQTLAEGPILGGCDLLISALDSFDRNGQLPEGFSNLRYWHGASAVFRPMLTVLGLPALRMLAFAALILSTLSLGRRVARLAGPTAAVALLTPLVVTTDYAELGHVAHHALALAVAVGGAELTLFAAEREARLVRSWFVAVIAGAAFVYVDLLTNVPGAWILVIATAVLGLRCAGAGARRVIAFGLTTGVGWLVGYGGMWMGKWVFAATILGQDRVWDDVRETIEKRIDGESQWSENRFGAAIGDNVEAWLDRPFTWIVLLASVIAIGAALTRMIRTGDSRQLWMATLAAAPALLPFVWFEVASNHSQIHYWFTYRSLPIALGVVLLAFLTGNAGRPTETGCRDVSP